MFSKGSRSFLPQQPNEIRKKGKMYKTPKAEVTGSNPVGCANPIIDIAFNRRSRLPPVSGVCPDNVFAGSSGNLDTEKEIPAAAGTVAGTNSKITTPLPYRTAPGFARYRVSSSLLVEVLA